MNIKLGKNLTVIEIIAKPVIAIMTIVFAFLLIRDLVTGKYDAANKDLVLLVIGVLSNTISLILGYYFGSSFSSQQKNEMLEGNVVKKNPLEDNDAFSINTSKDKTNLTK